MKSQINTFLDTAYGYQNGESYPERHIKNLESLAVEFPDYDKELIDCLYRLSIHLDVCALDFAHKIYHRHITKEEAMDHLAITFKQFSKGTRDWAMENAIVIHDKTK